MTHTHPPPDRCSFASYSFVTDTDDDKDVRNKIIHQHHFLSQYEKRGIENFIKRDGSNQLEMT